MKAAFENCLAAMREEFEAMASGKFIAYHKAAVRIVVFVALIFSLAFSHSTVFEAPVAVVDLDCSKASANLITDVNTSSFIRVTGVVRSPADPVSFTAHDANVGVLYIPRGYEKALSRGTESFSLGYFADFSNGAQNGDVISALNEIAASRGAVVSQSRITPLELNGSQQQAVLNPLRVVTRKLFNPASAATIGLTVTFTTFFSLIVFAITILVVLPRIRMSGRWEHSMRLGPLSFLCRAVPYAFIYTGSITAMMAVMVLLGQMRFEGSVILYAASLFMTCLAVAWLAFFLVWNTDNPSKAAPLSPFILVPGYLFSGATLAAGSFNTFAQVIRYLFPVSWQFSFLRDIALRGVGWGRMLGIFGWFVLMLAILALLVTLRWKHDRSGIGEEQWRRQEQEA
jgi:ABC-2 type transport system permease protein